MRILGFVLVVVAVLTAGCTSSAPEKTAPKLSSHVKPAKPIDPAKAAVLRLGDDLPLVAKLPTTIGGKDVEFFGVASANVVFGTLTARAKGKAAPQSHPILYNIESRSIVRLDDGFNRPVTTQVLGMVSSEATIVWVESPEPGATDGDTTVYTYERTSGARRERTLDPVPDHQLAYGSDLTIENSRILLSMESARREVGAGAAIYSGSINGGKTLKVLVEDGQDLTVDGDQMTYTVGTKKFVRDLGSGDTSPVTAGPKGKASCGVETVSVFTIRCQETVSDGSLLTVKDPDGHSTTAGPFLGLAPKGIRMIGPWIDIESTDARNRGQEYLLSPGTKTLKALPVGTSLDAGNAPELETDLTLLSQSGAHAQQWLVHIPST